MNRQHGGGAVRARKGIRRAVAVCVAVIAVMASACTSHGGGGGGGGDPLARICKQWSDPNATATGSGTEARGGGFGGTFLADHCLHLNQIQVIGSHNSYHIRPQEPVWSALRAFSLDLANSI